MCSLMVPSMVHRLLAGVYPVDGMATRNLLCRGGGGQVTLAPSKGGGGMGKSGFLAGPLVLCGFWGGYLAPKALDFIVRLMGKFFTLCICTQNTRKFAEN